MFRAVVVFGVRGYRCFVAPVFVAMSDVLLSFGPRCCSFLVLLVALAAVVRKQDSVVSISWHRR